MSRQHVKDLSDNQRELFRDGNGGYTKVITIRHQSSYLPELYHKLNDSWVEADTPDPILTELAAIILSHSHFHSSFSTHSEIYTLHPVCEHQLFSLVALIISLWGLTLFKARTMRDYKWGRVRHVIQTGRADASLSDLDSKTAVIAEIKYPRASDDDGVDLLDILKLIAAAERQNGFRLGLSEDGKVLTGDATTLATMSLHVIQVSCGAPGGSTGSLMHNAF